MTQTFNLAAHTLEVVDRDGRTDFISILPFQLHILDLLNHPNLGNVTSSQLKELYNNHKVRVDMKHTYQIKQTVLQVDINSLREFQNEILEAFGIPRNGQEPIKNPVPQE